MIEIIEAKEHEEIEVNDECKKKLEKLFKESKKFHSYLKLNKEFKVGYIIGIEWLTNEFVLVVEPKIENLNYLSMFLECLKHPVVLNKINKDNDEKVYEIFLDEKPIDLETTRLEITPLLIVHFLYVVRSIVKKGLMKRYVKVQENLTNKIKGKILISPSIKYNHLKNRSNKNYCEYYNFTIDCPENRILKKALLFANNYLIRYQISTNSDPLPIINQCLSAFSLVSEEVDINTIKSIKVNSFFKEYKDGLTLAKMILKYFGYSIHNIESKKHSIPPFYINMPKLFELFVYSKLIEYKNENIVYQPQGNYGQPDFIDINNKIIIDTKYKENYSVSYDIEDIRQLSGYARDEKILKNLNNNSNENVVKCLIIYPDVNGNDTMKNDWFSNKIDGFLQFYKYDLKLPTYSR